MATETIPPCPFPELLRFTDPEPMNKVLHHPFRSGTWAVATDGKVMACCHAADESLPTVQFNVVPLCDALWSINPTWRPLPSTMPDVPGSMEKCWECRGSGIIGKVEDCEECEGTGECPHCGHECDECDGGGVVETERPGEPCTRCGGSGSMQSGSRPVRVLGIPMAWKYIALLVGIRARVAVADVGRGRTVCFEGGTAVRGFVMPLVMTPEQTAELVSVIDDEFGAAVLTAGEG